MTRPVIDDAMVERFIRAGGFYQRGKSVEQCTRDGLEAALDRRTGEADRRKVKCVGLHYHRRVLPFGRRCDDKNWQDLPLAKPPIHVSEGMKRAACFAAPTVESIYRAMEAKRREEAGE